MIEKLGKIFSESNMHNALKQFGNVSVDMLLLFSAIGIAIVIILTCILKLIRKQVMASDVLTGIILAVYASIVLQLTLMCRESGSRIGIDMNLFHGLFGGDSYLHWLMWAYLILNVFMFVPFGFVVSMFSLVHNRKWGIQLITVILLGFIVSMVIEIAQLITQRGIFEVQDLAANTIGGVFGWLLFAMVFQIGRFLFGSKNKNQKEEERC